MQKPVLWLAEQYRFVWDLSLLLQYLHAVTGFLDTMLFGRYSVIVTEGKVTKSWKFHRICQFFRKRVISTMHCRVLHSHIIWHRISRFFFINILTEEKLLLLKRKKCARKKTVLVSLKNKLSEKRFFKSLQWFM